VNFTLGLQEIGAEEHFYELLAMARPAARHSYMRIAVITHRPPTGGVGRQVASTLIHTRELTRARTQGDKSRAVAATKMNATSSRSHSLVILHRPSRPGGRLSALSVFLYKSFFDGTFVWARRALNRPFRRFPTRAVASTLVDGTVTQGTLNLCDLAGSEKVRPGPPAARAFRRALLCSVWRHSNGV
jgi:hypothetical protein